MSTAARSPPQNPLIAIVGATGTGKSQLAVELAKRYNGEIINGDAMQLYSGLPIITNKITDEEKQDVPHHLLGCIGLHEPTWTVGVFVQKALSVIEEIRERGKLPILVGGTHYYTQNLLFGDTLANVETDDNGEIMKPSHTVDDVEEEWPILKEPTAIILAELEKIDPIMANRWHPNDRRKIQRSLAIYFQTGKRASDIYAEQRQQRAQNDNVQQAEDNKGQTSNHSSSMRFPTLVFWTHAESDKLKPRLEYRVDKMLETGLLDEVGELRCYAASELIAGRPIDETKGIWVSIGFKEFTEYSQALQGSGSDEVTLEKLRADAIEQTKAANRQYAKKQVRWIRIKLANALATFSASNTFFLLDGSTVSSFATDVVEPANTLAHQFLHGLPMPDPKSLSNIAAEQLSPKASDFAYSPGAWMKQHCEFCNATIVTEAEWERHTKSKVHRRLVAKAKVAAASINKKRPDEDETTHDRG